VKKRTPLVVGLALISLVSASAQSVRYQGTTSQGLPVQLTADKSRGCVTSIDFEVQASFPSSTKSYWHNFVRGCVRITGTNDTFNVQFPVHNGGLVAYHFAGNLTAELTAQGGLRLQQAGLLVVSNNIVAGAQLGDSGPVEWTATEAGGLPSAAAPLPLPKPGVPVIKLTDPKTGNIFVLQRLDSTPGVSGS